MIYFSSKLTEIDPFMSNLLFPWAMVEGDIMNWKVHSNCSGLNLFIWIPMPNCGRGRGRVIRGVWGSIFFLQREFL